MAARSLRGVVPAWPTWPTWPTRVEGLRRVQAFLDRRLNRRHDVTRTRPESPSPEVEAPMTIGLPQQWGHPPEG